MAKPKKSKTPRKSSGVNNRTGSDRRRGARYRTEIVVLVRFIPDGTPVNGAAVEIGPNGMRIETAMPIAEATYVHITFQTASNNTHCEGRVVWTQTKSDGLYESGVDIQKWGGGIPGQDVVQDVPYLREKPDRRGKRAA